jgi:hypothetical protein
MEEHIGSSRTYAEHELVGPPRWCWNVIWGCLGFGSICFGLAVILNN